MLTILKFKNCVWNLVGLVMVSPRNIVGSVTDGAGLIEMQRAIETVTVDEGVGQYCVRLVGAMATGLAGRIVGESLEDEARQRRTVERFIAELESSPSAAAS